MLTVIIMIIAVIILLVIAEIPYITYRRHPAENQLIDYSKYDYYYYISAHQ